MTTRISPDFFGMQNWRALQGDFFRLPDYAFRELILDLVLQLSASLRVEVTEPGLVWTAINLKRSFVCCLSAAGTKPGFLMLQKGVPDSVGGIGC